MAKLRKKDYSGKLLFLVGIILIGTSVFNLFEDPIVNQYYRLKRNFERQNIPTIAINTQDTPTVISNEPTVESTLSGQNSDSIDFSFEELDESGFLPLNVEVTEDNKETLEP